MDIEGKLLNTKHFHNQIISGVDVECFEKRLLLSLDKDKKSNKKRSSRKKKITEIAIPLLILPLAGFTYASTIHFKWSFIWHGSYISQTNQWGGPVSTAAQPLYPKNVLQLTTTTTWNLPQARRMGKFPIREPNKIEGWTKVLSEGVQFPLTVTKDIDSKVKVLSVSKTPVMYVDIYINNKGQRIAVTQQSNKYFSQKGTVVSGYGKDATLLHNFPAGDLALYIAGNWSDSPNYLPEKGDFENVSVLHHEKNNTITQIAVDEYGDVSRSVLESFAHAYLQASTS